MNTLRAELKNIKMKVQLQALVYDRCFQKIQNNCYSYKVNIFIPRFDYKFSPSVNRERFVRGTFILTSYVWFDHGVKAIELSMYNYEILPQISRYIIYHQLVT